MYHKKIVIGEDDNILEKRGCISTVVYGKREPSIREHVSSNRELFSVETPILNIHLYIMKDSKEGSKLKSMLEDLTVKDTDILNYLDEIAIKHVTIEYLNDRVEMLKKEAFEAGARMIQQKFKNLLDIEGW